jgi:serine/threonine protein kinase
MPIPFTSKELNGEVRPTLRYRAIKELNRGAMANAYEAEIVSGTGKGRRVFLKQYKSPTNKVPWYTDFVEYQKEMKRRIEGDAELKDRCYEMIEFFENKGVKDASGVFYQVFEFVEGGIPLTDYIKKFRDDPAAVEWKHRVVFARIMMFAINALHKAKIVHTDLKPDNFFMIPGKNNAGFSLKLIDLDFSIFSDKQAPWHGEGGYVGTPGYRSPEHLRGEVPQEASDIYTCGLILGELLGEGHPLRKESDLEKATAEGRFEPVKIEQAINKVDNLPFLKCVINSCFDTDPSKRPTAREILKALKGEVFEWHAWSGETEPVSEPPGGGTGSNRTTGPTPPPPPPPPPTPGRVELLFNDEKVGSCGIDTVFGRRLFKSVHEDAKFLSNQQFHIYKDPSSGNWAICHMDGATNETIINGVALTEPIFLQDGMTISVGNSSKNIEKLPLTVRLS